MLLAAARTTNFRNFLAQQYYFLNGLIQMYRIPGKGTKCNWSVLTAHLDTHLKSDSFRREKKAVFNVDNVQSLHNRIYSQIMFSLLTRIVRDYRIQIEKEKSCQHESSLDDNGLNVLRYTSGACIHNIASKLKASTERRLLGKIHEARVYYRATRFLDHFQNPESFLIVNSTEPETLM